MADKKTSFSCGNTIDIVHADQLRDRLIRSLKKSHIIELKADKVEKVDTAGLQLFAAAIRDIHAMDGKTIWKSPSHTLLEQAKLLGLTRQLSLSA